MATMTAACLVTSTYAWFSQNEVVWTEETDFNLDFYSGLLISFDGVNYHQDVTKEQLYMAVTGLDDEDAAEEAFKNIKLDGVTPLHENQKIQYDNEGYARFTYDTVNEETRTHEAKETLPNDVSLANNKYIRFDLYLKLATGSVATENSPSFKLKFSQIKDDNDNVVRDTALKSKAGVQNVTLLNKLTTQEKDYSAGETISVDGANALRVGVGTHQGENSMIVYEPVNEHNLGSAAIEGRTDDLHNPEKNAMYTYYNNFFAEKFTKAAEDGEAFDTHENFQDGTSLGTFASVKNSSNIYEYQPIKLTMYIWLEGWDADYFYGITSSNELSRAMQSSFVFSYEQI